MGKPVPSLDEIFEQNVIDEHAYGTEYDLPRLKQAIIELMLSVKPEKKINALKPHSSIVSEDGKNVDQKYLNQIGAQGFNNALDQWEQAIKKIGEKK